VPPAFSQSAWVVYCEKSPAAPDGLADGDEVEVPDVLGLMLPLEPDEPLEPPGPEEPDGVVPPALPEVLLPLPILASFGECARTSS